MKSIEKLRNSKPVILPSMLMCDFTNIKQECDRLADAGAQAIHLDVMDGVFVPNMTYGIPIVEAFRKSTDMFLDVHLMVSNPEFWVGPMADAGADSFTFHVEATKDPKSLIASIRSASRPMKVGVSIKPGTPIESILDFAGDCDILLVMTVEPGFGGQSFMPEMMSKVQKLRELFPTKDIEVDGGLKATTIDEAATAGANMIVAGSAVFKAADRSKAIAELRRSVEKYGNGKEGAL